MKLVTYVYRGISDCTYVALLKSSLSKLNTLYVVSAIAGIVWQSFLNLASSLAVSVSALLL